MICFIEEKKVKFEEEFSEESEDSEEEEVEVKVSRL